MFAHIKWAFILSLTVYKWLILYCIFHFSTLIVLIKLIDDKTSFHYRLKQCLVFSAFLFVPLLLVPVLLWRPGNVKNVRIVCYTMSLIAGFVDVTYEVLDANILRDTGPAVLVANHQIIMDALAVCFISKIIPKFTTVVKKEAFYFPPFGITGVTHGLIPIDRKNQKSAAATLARCKRVLHDIKAKILIFPEGTRNGGTSMLPFKTGAFRLAIEAQVPIIPVVISPYYFINFQNNIATPGRVTIQVLEPITTEGLTLADTNDLTERTRNKIVDEYEILKAKKVTSEQ